MRFQAPPVTLPAKTSGGRVLNFSAGPAMLPEPVLRAAQTALWDLDGSGIGILEHSHRGGAFSAVLATAEAELRALLGLDEEWAVLFLQGGASLQFAMVPMSFLAPHQTADYLDTGVWTSKAIAEANRFGAVHLAFAGAEHDYDHVPSAEQIDPSEAPAYTWYCSNNTVMGTQYRAAPSSLAPLVCDASSDVLSRPLALENHGLIFAGAQKNLGPAGCTLVLARRDLLAKARRDLPAMLDYRQHDAKGSCLNTPPTFAIYVMGRVFRWIRDEGGLAAMQLRAERRSAHLYASVDGSGGFYRAVAKTHSRSHLNVTFRTPSTELDRRLIGEAASAGFVGLGGHRNVGGLRASIYNAFPESGCVALADFLTDFAQRAG